MSPEAQRRSTRAAPMAPDERRRTLVEAVVPLLLEHGDAVTTKQIAEAAGVAEGTIFRVFTDKAALLTAAAEETVNPSHGREELREALAGVTELRARVLATIGLLQDRSERVVAVMMALRGVCREGGDQPGSRHPSGPPQFLVDSHRALLDRLTEVFEPHAHELTVEPRTAALLLRTLVLGARHPGADREQVLSPDQIADALLDGIRSGPGGA